VGTGDNDLVRLRAKALFHRGDDRGEEGIVEIGNEDSDDLGPPKRNIEASGSAR